MGLQARILLLNSQFVRGSNDIDSNPVDFYLGCHVELVSLTNEAGDLTA